MPVPQLIGLNCAACQKAIRSIVDGAFCSECGNPVHRKCERTDAEPMEDVCHRCGGDPDSDIAIAVSQERDAELNALARKEAVDAKLATHPISSKCPQCAGTDFTPTRPNKWIAFSADRICTTCDTRYSPPTPQWAAIVFIVIGVILGGFGGLSVVGAISSVNPVAIPLIACEGFLAMIGILAIIHGIRSLQSPME